MIKKLLGWVVVLAVLSGHALHAQDITGTWQGTLEFQGPQGSQSLRMVFKVTNEGGALKAVMYSIDQGGQAIGASRIIAQGSAVSIAIPALGATFEGKLSPDGTLIAGTLTQGPTGRALNLARASADTAWAIPTPPAAAKPMAADANLVFEVATIKPSKPEAPGKAILFRGRQFSTLNTTLTDLITFAYGVQAKQVVGGPAWAETDKFDILAQPEAEGSPNDRQLKTMMQKLLTDRFKLTFHHDKKELSVYALIVAKGGPKLTKSEGDPNGLPGLGFGRPGAMIVRNANMGDFASTMQNTVLDRPVIDQTALQGRFDFTLNWTPDEFQFAGLAGRIPPPADGAALPNLYTAIQEQIGLRLDSTKAPADVLVIDRVEKPSEN